MNYEDYNKTVNGKYFLSKYNTDFYDLCSGKHQISSRRRKKLSIYAVVSKRIHVYLALQNVKLRTALNHRRL